MAPVDCNSLTDASDEIAARCDTFTRGRKLLAQLRNGDKNSFESLEQTATRFLEPASYTMVSQGGVSLGSWQAGYAYVVTERLKAMRGSQPGPVYRTVAGASAGAVNALASGLEGCRSTPRSPKDTLAWKVWVEHLRLFHDGSRPGLLDEPAAGDEGAALFSDEPVRAAMDDARREFAAAVEQLQGTCAFDLGFVATHLTATTTPIHVQIDKYGDVRESITSPRASERFAVGVTLQRGATPGTDGTVSFRNVFELPTSDGPARDSVIPDQAYFAQLGLESRPKREDLLAGIRASGAFPFAFPPVRLGYRSYNATARRFVAKSGLFVDGGVLENTPLGLAVAINHRRDLHRDNPWFGDLSSRTDTYVYISPGVHAWEAAYRGLNRESGSKSYTPLGIYINWLSSVAGAGSMARLAQATEQYAFLRQDRDSNPTPPRMVVPLRYFPITGDHLGHFFAFTEREFRVFDYVVGMVDADVNFVRIVPGTSARYQVALGASREPQSDRVPEKFECVRAFYQQCIFGEGKVAGDCGDKPKLPKACNDTGSQFQALVRANWRFRLWSEGGSPGEDQDALDVFLGMLTSEGFEFRDAPEDWRAPLKASDGLRFTRRLAGVAIDRLTEKEGWFTRKSLRAGGRMLADAALYREFPSFLVQVGYPERGIEAGPGFKLAAWGQNYGLRLDVLGRVYGYGSQYVFKSTADHYRAKFLNLDGSLSVTGILSPSPGIVDIEVSTGRLVSFRTMPAYDGGHWVFLRTGAQLAVSTVLLQRAYLRFENQWFWRKVTNDYFAGTTQEDTDNYRLQISLGLRFF